MKKEYIAERARQLKISSFSISNSLRMGSFNSAFKGQGIEFDSVREYKINDDIRSIDWNLTARTAKTFVKEYKEEKDLTIFLCADFSKSMRISIEKITPIQKTMETIALMAFAGLNISCPIGAIFFSSEKGPIFQPHTSEEHILTILKTMEDFEIAQKNINTTGTILASALKAVTKILRSKSMVIIISDFKVEGYEKELGLLASKHDVICIKITNPLDESIPSAGAINFKDAEQDFRTILPTNSKQFQMEYKNNFLENISRWEGICKRVQANPLILKTDDDIVKKLSTFFLSKQSQKKINNLRARRWKVF